MRCWEKADVLVISAVIVAYENHADVRSTVEMLLRYEPLVTQVVIVDHSRSASRRAYADFERVVYLPQKNVGFGAGVNVAVEAATEPVVWILNADVSINSSVAAPVMAKVAGVERWIASPLIRYPSGAVAEDSYRMWWLAIERRADRLLERLRVRALPHVSPQKISGTTMFVPRRVLQDLGGFDEKFFMYFEDADLSLRARADAIPLLVVHEATLVHRAGTSALTWRAEVEGYRGFGAVHIARKHRGEVIAWAVFFESVVGVCARFVWSLRNPRSSRPPLTRISGGWRALMGGLS